MGLSDAASFCVVGFGTDHRTFRTHSIVGLPLRRDEDIRSASANNPSIFRVTSVTAAGPFRPSLPWTVNGTDTLTSANKFLSTP